MEIFSSPFCLTLLGNIIISLGIIFIISIVKIFKTTLSKYLEYFTAITVGLLLGIIFIGFIPELTTNGGIIGDDLGIFILIGISLFYILELFLHWHHCKDLDHKDKHSHSHNNENAILIFSGTLLHNIFHGIVLFSAFAVDFNFGFATTIAILLHSIPQNIINYIMNHKKIIYTYIAAFGGIFGAILTYPFKSFLITNKYYFLAIITGGLLYTALADIFPEIKGKGNINKKISYFLFILFGLILFIMFENISHH